MREPRAWPLALVAAPAAVAIWSGWVGLGGLAGFGVIHPLPGVWPGLTVNTAITLPVGVESYGALALHAWLTAGSERVRVFARRSALAALALGALGQIVFHVLAAAHVTRAPVIVVAGVACLPVVTLASAAGLACLVRGEAVTSHQAVITPRLTSGDETTGLVTASPSEPPDEPDEPADEVMTRRRVTDAQRDEVRRLLARGVTREQAARAAGVSPSTVDRVKKHPPPLTVVTSGET